jgi:LysR family nitrogen assimilation transcriptional regulator
MMDLTSIRYFVHCAEVRSLTAAAKDLAVAQPALTRRIHRLEEEYGVQLFERQARGVSLTADGQKFLEHCRRILREVSLAGDAIGRGPAAAERVFSLGVPGTCAATLVPELISGLRHLFPRIHLDVTEGTTPALVEDLLAGRIDLAVLQNPPAMERLVTTPHLVEPLVVVMAAEQAPPGESIALKELVQLPLVLTKGILKLVNEQIQCAGHQLRVDYTISSPQAIRTLLLRGLGATIIPVSTFQHDIASGRVKALTVADVHLRRTLATAHLAKPTFAGLDAAIGAVRATLDALARDGHFTWASPSVATGNEPVSLRPTSRALLEAD